MILKFIAVAVVVMLPLFGCKKEEQKAEQQKQAAAAPAPAQKATPPPAPPAPAEKKVEKETYSYESKGRRDPFFSIIEASKKERQKEAEKKKKGVKPSEQFDLPDLKIIAIAKDARKHYAMVQLPDKKYFTVQEGMTLGLYGGKVVRIDANSVVVREYITDYRGEVQPRDYILKLRKEEGE